jgi:hypothetical protein
MVYGLYLTLDQKRWFRGDYSDEDLLTGTIYTDINRTTAKNLTGYTLTVRMHRPIHFGDFFNQSADIVVAASGTFSVTVAQGTMPPRGTYFVKVELAKSGTVVSTLNRVELDVLGGPHG